MELNKTTESLYSSKTDTRNVHHDSQAIPEPKDNRDVQVFSLEGKQQTRQEKASSNKSHSRTESRKLSDDDKRVNDEIAEAGGKEEELKEESQELCFAENAFAGMSLIDIAGVGSTETIVEVAPVAVAGIDTQWIQDLILSTVESMVISEMNGDQLVELVLDANANVPEVFAGANLTLVQSGKELSVKFSSFVDAAQMTEAANLVVNNPSQLTSLVNALKNYQLTLKEFTVGNLLVQLPKLEEMQTPLHMIASTIRHRDEERDQRDQNSKQQQDDKEQNSYTIEEARL
ncbi:hypothetical protein C10C_0675 [Chlamydia serpentis]|uniref:Outer protein E n=1 Tax=Chlamydia serpentis TaxID=1967782 RepID=A0A2R8FBN0_9CHLA|nr:DUF5421 family protein [Chlamydia serpentis]SPN73823.1 hypothetical protein C10C_0675 [Chlamydia serpentis]